MTEDISFDQLPLHPDGPRGNAWFRHGDSDQLGTLNRLTESNTIAAAKEIQDGTRVATDWQLDALTTPFFTRQGLEHEIRPKENRSGNDDVLTFNTQCSSQWDGFRHYGYQSEHLFYGNKVLDDLLRSKDVLGIHSWVEKGGVVGRGVLLDYVSWMESQNLPVDPFKPTSIPVSSLISIAKAQNTTLLPGDILFIRTGFVRAQNALSPPATAARASSMGGDVGSIGVEPSEATLRWLWESRFAAVAGDQLAFEPWPFQSKEWCLHEWLLAGWGMPIGELFDLERLSEVCKEKNRWSFFFSSMPLNVPGGVASPPNGVAIF